MWRNRLCGSRTISPEILACQEVERHPSLDCLPSHRALCSSNFSSAHALAHTQCASSRNVSAIAHRLDEHAPGLPCITGLHLHRVTKALRLADRPGELISGRDRGRGGSLANREPKPPNMKAATSRGSGSTATLSMAPGSWTSATAGLGSQALRRAHRPVHRLHAPPSAASPRTADYDAGRSRSSFCAPSNEAGLRLDAVLDCRSGGARRTRTRAMPA